MEQNFLRMETGDLCASYHEEILRKPHVIGSFSGNGGHPLKRSPNPFIRHVFTGDMSPITTFEDEFKKTRFPIKHPEE